MSRIRRFCSSIRGQAAVEFALLAPVALILIMAIWEFGRAWNSYQVLTDAVREGARVAVISNADQTLPIDTVYTSVNTRLFRAALDSTLDVTTLTGFRTGIGQPATVSIAYPYQLTYLGALLQWTTGEKNVTLRTSFTMRNE